MLRAIGTVLLLVCVSGAALGQQPDPKTIKQGIETLRQSPADKRGGITRQLALEIRA
jgi:hypothetical protein